MAILERHRGPRGRVGFQTVGSLKHPSWESLPSSESAVPDALFNQPISLEAM